MLSDQIDEEETVKKHLIICLAFVLAESLINDVVFADGPVSAGVKNVKATDKKEFSSKGNVDEQLRQLKQQSTTKRVFSKNHLNKINEQTKILEENSDRLNKDKNINELYTLTLNKIAINEESLEDIKKHLDDIKKKESTKEAESQDNSGNAVVQIDLFDLNNLKTATAEALDFVIDRNATSKFIYGNYYFRDVIYGNEAKDIKPDEGLKKSIIDLRDYLRSQEISDNKQIEAVIKKLRAIQEIADRNDHINNYDPFVQFVSGTERIFQSIILRRVAKTIMKNYKSIVEQSTQTTVKKNEITVGAGGNINGILDVEAGVTIAREEGADDSSFYMITTGTELEIKVSNSFFAEILKLTLGAGTGITEEEVFFSLEQLLDSGKFNGGIFESEELKQIRNSRSEMQQCEKKLLAVFSGFVESYLKMMSIVPVSTYINWPIITKSSEKLSTTTVSGAIGSTFELFEKYGFQIKYNSGRKAYHRSRKYLKMLSDDADDCSLAAGFDIKDIDKILDKKNKHNLSEKYLLKQGTSVKEGSLEVSLSTILGDLRKYNITLAAMAQIEDQISELTARKDKLKKKYNKKQIDKLDKQIRDLNDQGTKLGSSKHEIEHEWIGGTKSNLRDEFFKTMIVTLVHMREHAKTKRDIELFRQLYIELTKLEELQDFSKSKFKRKNHGMFVSSKVDYNSAITGTLTLPYGTEVEFTRSEYGDEPFQEIKGADFELKFTLPLTSSGVLGKAIIESALGGLLSKNIGGENSDTKELSDVLKSAKDRLIKYINESVQSSKEEKNIKKEDIDKFSSAIQASSDVASLSVLFADSALSDATGISLGNSVGTSEFSIAMTKIDSHDGNTSLPKDGQTNTNPSEVIQNKEDISLPGNDQAIKSNELIASDDIIKIGRSRWRVQYIQVITFSNLGFGVEVSKGPVILKAETKTSWGQRTRIIGTDTLSYVTSKYDAWMLGLEMEEKNGPDKIYAQKILKLDNVEPIEKSKNTLWTAFEDEQKVKLYELFNNIDKPKSNARFELQCMYNDILDGLESVYKKAEEQIRTEQKKEKKLLAELSDLKKRYDDISKTCKITFENFLEACGSKNYSTAMTTFYDVLYWNHLINFLVDYCESYKIDQE